MPLGSVRLAGFLSRPELLMFLPVAALAAFWVGGQAGLLAFAGLVPLLLAVLRRPSPCSDEMPVSDQVIRRLEMVLGESDLGLTHTGCFVVQFDSSSLLVDRHGRARQSGLLAASIGRLRGALRPGDVLYPMEDGSLVIVLAASDRLDLEAMMRIAGRLQMVVHQPLTLGDGVAQVTCCIGFCHAGQVPARTGQGLLDAAQVAVDEAVRCGPGSLRSFSTELARARTARDALRAAFLAAADGGQIRAWFQPQLSTDTGEVSGLEALVRWHHPVQGCLAPGQFLPALAGTDLMERLGEVMLTQSLDTLVALDQAGLRVPRVSVNFSVEELRNPDLPERLMWQMDRKAPAPSRLGIEVLESVIAGDGDDMIARNLSRLADLGFHIELDDFGTGNASITSIRRFALHRLKIDRSFIRGIDSDRSQQRLVVAILSLAEELGLETLGEGVETPQEHAMIAQLGCSHAQGYAIARPMPAGDVAPWIRQHDEALRRALRLGVRAR
jgi:diguanylate cyclase